MNMRVSIVCMLLVGNFCFGQINIDSKRDYTWPLGNASDNNHHHSLFHFDSYSFTQSTSYTPIYTFVCNSGICDTSGKLLFYTNGMYVCDSTNHIMPHGDSLSFGDIYIHMQNSFYGYPVMQGALTLPLPGSNKLFYIFHEKADWFAPPANVIFPGVQFSLIDMTLNQGKGDIVIKNQTAIRDTVNSGNLTAVRHANGRDWWIIAPGFFVPVFHTILLGPTGLTTFKQTVPCSPSFIPEVGQAVFSPDGSKYIRCGSVDFTGPIRLEVYSFDRCSGLLSDFIDLTGLCDISDCPPSLCVSPNSQYLYVANGYTLYQFDLLSANIGASKQVVANYDNFQWYNTPTLFWVMQLAPDGRIYISSAPSPYLHIIDQPNNQGISCNVLQHGITLTYKNDEGLPNYPNFRLGPVVGSPCDTLYNEISENYHNIEWSLGIFPNPGSDLVTFNLNELSFNNKLSINIYNPIGQKIDVIEVNPNESMINYNTSNLSNGIYHAIVSDGVSILNSAKFVILKN